MAKQDAGSDDDGMIADVVRQHWAAFVPETLSFLDGLLRAAAQRKGPHSEGDRESRSPRYTEPHDFDPLTDWLRTGRNLAHLADFARRALRGRVARRALCPGSDRRAHWIDPFEALQSDGVDSWWIGDGWRYEPMRADLISLVGELRRRVVAGEVAYRFGRVETRVVDEELSLDVGAGAADPARCQREGRTNDERWLPIDEAARQAGLPLNKNGRCDRARRAAKWKRGEKLPTREIDGQLHARVSDCVNWKPRMEESAARFGRPPRESAATKPRNTPQDPATG